MFPVVLADGLDKSYKQKWDVQFVANRRTRAEGIWRRTQVEETKQKSGWQSADDARRRMIHFLDSYDVVESGKNTSSLVIDGSYLWLSITLPENECIDYHQKVVDALAQGGWKKESSDSWRLNDLSMKFDKYDQHPEDIKAGREIPANYLTYEYTFISDGMDITDRLIGSPWEILSTGIRKLGTRVDNPRVSKDIQDLKPFLPAQFELGGGASIDMGIPPLNHLHQIYSVTVKENGNFMFGEGDSILTRLIGDPKKFYLEAGDAYRRCLLAEPNEFYKALRTMFDKGLAVGEVITNNFDGVTSLVGLTEKYVRRYDEPKMYPDIDFHPDAKSLIVVGSHADRRRVQKQARDRGMKVIYIDPENYYDYYGNQIDYPLEDVKQDDIVYHMTAVEFGRVLNELD